MSLSPDASTEARVDAAPGARRRRPLYDQPLAWVVLFAVYVALGVVFKSAVLNWVVGPLFPLVFLYLVPRALGLLRDA